MAIVDNLVGYWKMNEASWDGTAGEVIDSSLNTNNGTSAGASITTGKLNNCGGFDGVNDNVTIPSNSTLRFGTGRFSVAFWFKTGTNQRMTLINNYYDPSDDGWYIDLIKNTNNIRFGIQESASNYYLADSSDSNLDDNAWHYVVCVKPTIGANQTKIYIDGASNTGSYTNNGTANNSDPTTKDLQFAAPNSVFFSTHTAGLIDDVAIWGRAITFAEITELYNGGAGKEISFDVTPPSFAAAPVALNFANTYAAYFSWVDPIAADLDYVVAESRIDDGSWEIQTDVGTWTTAGTYMKHKMGSNTYTATDYIVRKDSMSLNSTFAARIKAYDTVGNATDYNTSTTITISNTENNYYNVEGLSYKLKGDDLSFNLTD